MRTAAILLLCLLLKMPRAVAETVNRIIAVVNDDVITQADVSFHLDALLEDQEESAPNPSDAAQMHRAVLERLIEQRLILQEAKRAGVSIGIEEIVQRFEALRARSGSEQAFRESLANSGLTEEGLKEKIHEQLMVQRLIDQQIRSTIVVSPQEVAREIGVHPTAASSREQVRASHILIRVNAQRSEADARALIEKIRGQLAQGADVATLAKQYSEDPQAQEGGAMGWVSQGELMPELDGPLFHLKAGEVSDPIQTRLGFHLVKVEERRAAPSVSAAEVSQRAYQELYRRKFQEAFSRWLTQLKRRAYIHVFE